METVSEGFVQQKAINFKRKNENIGLFYLEKYERISAILYREWWPDRDNTSHARWGVVHNPNAKVPLPYHILRVGSEYTSGIDGNNIVVSNISMD